MMSVRERPKKGIGRGEYFKKDENFYPVIISWIFFWLGQNLSAKLGFIVKNEKKVNGFGT